MIKVGIGYDVHQLEEGRPLIIGGVPIPCKFGSVGHSDGDALIHSIVDALLGAAGLGDIGKYFPNSIEWKNSPSDIFLIKTMDRIKRMGYALCNIDSTIIIQSPRMENYIEDMEKNIARIMKQNQSLISIKATTTDKLGFIGDGKGWGTMAVATLESIDK